MVLKLSAEDIKNARPWPDGWYEAEQTAVIESLSKEKDSINFDIKFDVTSKTGDIKTVNCLINNKNKEMFNKRITAYLHAMEAIKEGEDFEGELKDLNGTKLKVHLVIDTYGGIPNNKVDNFMPLNVGGSEIPLNI